MKTSSCYAIRYWPMWFGFGLLWLLVKLPYRWQLTVGRLFGHIIMRVTQRLRKIAMINIDLCFPDYTEKQRKILVKKSFESAGIAILETGMALWASPKKLKALAHIQGYEYLATGLQQGKGVLLLGAHFSTLEIIGRLVSLHHPVNVMYNPPKNPVLAKILEKHLKQHYPNAFTRQNLRGMIKSLKNNQPIWYTPDVDPGRKHGVFAPFFGIIAASVTTVSRLSELTSMQIIPTTYYRRSDGKGYDITGYPALENFPSGNLEQDATRINQLIEEMIRKAPEQYIWQYKRFKTRPLGDKDFYE